MAEIRLNFEQVSILVADCSEYSISLLRQMLRGFGSRSTETVSSIEEAQAHLEAKPVDLCIIETRLIGGTGFDLLRWMRRHPSDAVRFAPVLMLTGYAEMRNVAETRDSGANILVKKPISPQILFDHIAWCAATKRTYVQAKGYVGPDRRFQDVDPPDGKLKRETDVQPKAEGGDQDAAAGDGEPETPASLAT